MDIAKGTNKPSHYDVNEEVFVDKDMPPPSTLLSTNPRFNTADDYNVGEKRIDNNIDPFTSIPAPGVFSSTATTSAGVVMAGVPLYPETPELNNKFKVQGYKDVWAAVLFLITVLFTLILGIISLTSGNFSSQQKSHIGGVQLSKAKLCLLILGVSLMSIVLSIILLKLFQIYPYQLIVASIFFNIILLIGCSVVGFIIKAYFFAVMTLIIAIFAALFSYFGRSRIRFSAVLLKWASTIIQAYYSLILFALLAVIVFYLYLIFWSAMMYRSMTNVKESGRDNIALDAAVIFFGVLFFFWTEQICTNVLHVTTSGVAATWYFVGGKQYMPPNPGLHSLKRACTTSFGSICFGSLLVAFLRMLRFFVQSMRNDNQFVACILDCILGCIESLIVYFNTYAFVYCAIYGYGYIEAAKKTFDLAKKSIFAAAFNNVMISWTIFAVSFALSSFIFVIFWMLINITLATLSFFLCFSIFFIIFSIIDSSVTTLFVCIAEEPDILSRVNPDLYQELSSSSNGGNHNTNSNTDNRSYNYRV